MPGIKRIKDRVAVVTGAGSGIGRASARALAAEGARLVVADVDRRRLEAVVGEFEEKGTAVAGFRVDVSDKTQVAELARFALDTYGRADILHNNAGVGWAGLLEDFSLEDWEHMVAVNLWSVIYGIHYFLPHMIARQSGHIVNTASMGGFCGVAALGAYTATKHAVIGLSDVLRAEVRRQNIGVSAICPGMVNTNIVRDGKLNLKPAARMDQAAAADFFRRFGHPPEKVGKAVVRAVKKNRGLVPVGPEARLMWYLKRASQSAYQAYVRMSARIALWEKNQS